MCVCVCVCACICNDILLGTIYFLNRGPPKSGDVSGSNNQFTQLLSLI